MGKSVLTITRIQQGKLTIYLCSPWDNTSFLIAYEYGPMLALRLSSKSAWHTYLKPLIISAHRLLLINPYVVSVVGVRKEGLALTSPRGYLNRKLPFVELLWELLALYRFSVVNVIGNAIVWPDKFETSPMAHDGLMETVAERGSGCP